LRCHAQAAELLDDVLDEEVEPLDDDPEPEPLDDVLSPPDEDEDELVDDFSDEVFAESFDELELSDFAVVLLDELSRLSVR
jgi:hypothetical protein